MRINEYYSRIVRDGRRGAPTIQEARADYRRTLEAQLGIHRNR
ncbi:MAG: hypothetical protein O2798_03150 [Chloroflexi bacterium]|nr:hypothetical protein [Chloroflexota bacterium]MDA1239821.1 hypothetical protein [Chloroflexota bacterium]